MEELRALGEEVWFSLGDDDLAICLQRARRLAAGDAPTEAADALRRALRRAGARAADERLAGAHLGPRARALARFQEFMIRERAPGPVDGVEFRGAADAAPTPEVARRAGGGRARSSSGRQPGHLDRPDPGGARAARGARGARRRPSWRSPRSSGARCSRARPRRSWLGRGPADERRARRAYAGLIDGLVADERGGRAADARDRRAPCRRRGAPAAWPSETLGFALALRARG